MTFARLTRLSLIAPHGDGGLPASQASSALRAEPRSNEVAKPSLETLLESHLDLVYRYALRLSRNREQAQDLTQETMLRAWRSRKTLKDDTAMKSWLLRIATNLWTDQIRGIAQQPQLLVEPPTCPAPNTSSQLIQQEEVAQAQAALDRLPLRQRQVMQLVTIEQLPHAEVAQVLQISPQAVKASLSQARKTMREQLRDLYREVRGRKPCATETNVNNSKTT